MVTLEQLEKLRAPFAKELRIVLGTLFVATAACMAVTLSDMVDHNLTSATGNFGLFCVLERVYLIAPRTLAITRGGSPRWIQAETEYLMEHFPWYDIVGKFGWVCLMISVTLQLIAVSGAD
ncbi:MAG TPA: hypothetical protein DD376_04680 [Sutterella sp.]|nr:hypothetical protein [Sutterella sp.]